MIYRDCTINVKNDVSELNEDIILYRGDREVEIYFSIVESPYLYSKLMSKNIIEKTNASYAQMIIKVPNDKPPIIGDITGTNEGKVVLKITGEMIDEIEENGDYDFQIRLYDDTKVSRVTIPPVLKKLHIKEPIAIEDNSTSNLVGIAKVGYTRVGAEGVQRPTLNEDQTYNKKTWIDNEPITKDDLNVLEDIADKNTTNIKNHNHDTVYAKKTEIPVVDVTKEYVNTKLALKSDVHEHPYLSNKTVIPNKTSQLTNDSNFITAIPSEYITESELSTKGYITNEAIKNKVDKEEGKGLSTNDLTATLKGNYDKAYTHSQSPHAPANAQKNSDITKEEIEAKLVDNITTHTHDQYLTEHQDISKLALKSEIVKSYNQLTDKPVIPSIVGLAKEAYVDTKVAGIVNSAPETLNTLQELATALGNDPNFATTVAKQIGEKAGTEYVNTELGKKVNTEGYVATENSYTTIEKTKLQGIQEGANNYTHPAKHDASIITQDSTHKFITDAERQTWNNKSDFDGNYNKLTNKPIIPTVTNDLTTTLKSNYDSAYAHSQSAHAPSNAQRNADITKGEIETKLTGNITTHTHSQYLTQHQSLADYARKSEIPNRVSQLQNDANYAKESSIDTKISERLGNIKIKKLTKQEFDGLGSKDPNCLYIIIKTM